MSEALSDEASVPLSETATPHPSSAPVCAQLPSVAICVATSGRTQVLTQCLAVLREQTSGPDELLICPAGVGDCDERAVRALFADIRIVTGEPGLPAQRNTLLEATRSDIVVFLDDDFIVAPDFVENTRALFAAHPDVVGATGEVVADGILGPGFEIEEARALLDAATAGPVVIADVHNAYGCNMVVRRATVFEQGLRFDTNLPLYAWLEDVDFCRRLAPFGRIVKSSALRGVHLGTKKGRGRGRRLGYSQIVNPLYLHRKGSLSLRRALAQMARNLAANAAKSLRPEPWVDRRGRLVGNLMGLGDVARGRSRPARILEFD